MKRVIKKAQSPMNAVLWLLTLECGHTRWVTGTKPPLRACCRWCDAGKVLGKEREESMRRKFIGAGTPAGDPGAESQWITEQELDEIPTYCSSCGRVHGTEDCGLHNVDD